MSTALDRIEEEIENGFTIAMDDGRIISVRAWCPFNPGMPALLVSPERGATSWEVIETDDLEDLAIKMETYAPIDEWEAIHKPPPPMMTEEGIAKLNDAISSVVADAVKIMKESKT